MLYRISRVTLRRYSPASAAAITLAGVAIALLLRFVVDDWLPPGFPYLTFFPAVILTGFFLGNRAGIASALLCGLCAWYFFIAPANSFALSGGAVVALGFYVLVVGTDLALIELMRRALRQMSGEHARATQLARTNALMFHELQHRVSNNLQVIASLLKMQRRNLADPAAQAALDMASARLDMVSRVQRRLHDPNRQEIDLSALLEEMAPEILEMSGSAQDVALRLDTRPVRVSSDQSVPLALICAELIANALEHGRDGAGRLDLELRCTPAGTGRALLEVADGGPGLPEGFDLDQARSLGLRIARQFAQQLEASLTMADRPSPGGTRASLSFPVAS